MMVAPTPTMPFSPSSCFADSQSRISCSVTGLEWFRGACATVMKSGDL